MGKFKENDRVIISEGELEEASGTIRSMSSECYNMVLNSDQSTDEDDSVFTEQEELQLKLECIKNNLSENGIVLTEGEDLLDYSYYYEMAGRIPGELKVGKKRGILIIAVGANEDRGEAHFHVFRSKNDLKAWKNGACLLFKENKYFDHADNRETLTRDEMETLIQCLKAKPADGLLGDTYWQFLINLWNQNNYDFKIDLDTPMPDYNYDTITRYKGTEKNVIKENKPLFKIGDVVANTDPEEESYGPYFIKEAIFVDNGDEPSEYMYNVSNINNPDENYTFKEDDLILEYHDENWEQYVIESVSNNLPPWRGELYNYMKLDHMDKLAYQDHILPIERMSHILDEHSFYRRIDKLWAIPEIKQCIIERMKTYTEGEIKRTIATIKTKIRYYNGVIGKDDLPRTKKGDPTAFNDDENKLLAAVDYIDKYMHSNESKDHYPPYMSDYAIMKAIQEAYGNAEKIEKPIKRYPSDPRKILFQGTSDKGLTIHFYFNFEDEIIETAYPVFVDTNNRPDLRHPDNKRKKH